MLAEVVPLSIRGRGEADEGATLMLILQGWGKSTWPEHNTSGKGLTVRAQEKSKSYREHLLILLGRFYCSFQRKALSIIGQQF